MIQDETPLEMDVQEDGEIATIVPGGYLNALTGDRIDKACDELIGRGSRYIIVNFSQIEMINTIGISILVGIIEKVVTRHGLVYFTHLGGTNREIFEVLGLSSVAMIFPDEQSAREHIEHDRQTYRRAIGDA